MCWDAPHDPCLWGRQDTETGFLSLISLALAKPVGEITALPEVWVSQFPSLVSGGRTTIPFYLQKWTFAWQQDSEELYKEWGIMLLKCVSFKEAVCPLREDFYFALNCCSLRSAHKASWRKDRDMLPLFFIASYVFEGCHIHSPLIKLTTSWAQMISNVLYFWFRQGCEIHHLCCILLLLSQHDLSFFIFTLWQLVIWHLWEAALSVEYLTRPCGSQGISALRNAKLQCNQRWKWSALLGGCQCELARGDYTGFSLFWQQGEIDLNSSWPQCIMVPVKSKPCSQTWVILSTLKVTQRQIG